MSDVDHWVCLDLFWRFMLISLVAFGGSQSVLPLVERMAVRETGWVGEGEFAAALGGSYLTPGPILMMATFIGYRVGGWAGAIAATLGAFLTPWLIAASAVGLLKPVLEHRRLRAFSRGAGAAVVGLQAVIAFDLARHAFTGSVYVVVASVSGSLGVAGGEMRIPALMYLFALPIKEAGTISLLVSIPTVAAGAATYRRLEHLPRRALAVALLMGVGSLVGVVIGASLLPVVSMHDITARKEAEAALRTAHEGLERRVEERTADLGRANDALREADRSKGELLDSLRDSEGRFRTMAESIPQLAWMARPDGHIYWYNKRWHDYTGTTPEEMEGWGWQRVHDPEVLPEVLGRWKASIASGQPFDMVFPLKGADGQFRPFLTRVAPVRGEGGRIAHWFGTNTDIADRLLIEEELRTAKEEAEAASRAKTQFLAVLSHELRTPLNPILLATSSMLERPAEPEEIRPILEMIRQNVNLQARLIDDLLDVMRIVRGKMPLHWGVADCHKLIEQAIQICRSEVLGGEIRLERDLAATHRQVNVDSARLQQVFWNLIKNTVKFTPGGGAITIRTRNVPGSGGPVDRIVVEAHGGTIEAESRGKDLGTTFRVVLKALPEQAVEADGEPVGGGPTAGQVGPSSLRILVVEDEPATLRLMARLLRGLGHAVTTSGTIASAYEAFGAGEFDLIVSDIGLPDGTGLDLIRRVVALRGHVPAIALTGYGMEEDIVRSREAGSTAHMTKPIDFTKLEAMIRQVAN